MNEHRLHNLKIWSKIMIIGGAILLAVAFVGKVWAADFDAKILDISGGPLHDEKGKEVVLTVREAVVNALLGVYPDEQTPPLTGEEKLHRFELAKKVQTNNPALSSLLSEDIALMKKLVNKYYPSPLIGPQVSAALERPAPSSLSIDTKGGGGPASDVKGGGGSSSPKEK